MNNLDIFVSSTCYCGVAICFFLSSNFHITNNHSRCFVAFGNLLDYFGVVLLIWGVTISTVYYGFYDDVKLRIGCWAMVSVLSGMCCIETMDPKFRAPRFQAYRSMMYAALGLSTLISIVHTILSRGFAKASNE